MATDGLSLYATLHELQSLVDSRIDKVQEPDKDILILHLHGSSIGRAKLMINIHNENGRIQLTQHVFENPDNPPSFCMLLRKYLIGCRIASIKQCGFDRIVSIKLQGRNEFKDEISLEMIIELMGKHGNVFLTDSTGKILDCMRHFGLSEDSVRICLPNCIYAEPPKQPDRLYPYNLNEHQLSVLSGGHHPSEWMQHSILGISRLAADQICPSDCKEDMIGQECYDVFSSLFDYSFTPSVIPDRGVLPFKPKNTASVQYSSMCEAQEAYYRMKDEKTVLTKKRTSIRACADHALKRVTNKLEAQSFQIGNEDAANTARKYGELILSNLSTISVTPGSAVVTDYYMDPPVPVSIPLDRKLSVKQNADLYFKRYHKLKAAREYALSQIDSLNAEKEYLESILVATEQCSTAEELNEIRDELLNQGYLKADLPKKSSVSSQKSEPYIYRSPSGSVIRVGKNNYQNDRLLKSESPDSYWFHVKNNPGSHVYLEEAAPTAETIFLAAQIAAFHSKSSLSANVAVDYTLHRYVKKPSGARPGFVNYFHQHTLYVTPDPDCILKYREH